MCAELQACRPRYVGIRPHTHISDTHRAATSTRPSLALLGSSSRWAGGMSWLSSTPPASTDRSVLGSRAAPIWRVGPPYHVDIRTRDWKGGGGLSSIDRWPYMMAAHARVCVS